MFITLIFIIFLTQVISNQIFNKENLRDLYKKETDMMINNIINKKYESIYLQITENAKYGFSEIKSTIFCENDIKSITQLELPYHMIKYMFTISSKDNFTTKILDKIKKTFPDINVTSSIQKLNSDEESQSYREIIVKCKLYKFSW